ncbi:MAG: AMP-binding protein [Candidatus Gastranaerophilales bacterium]|nr:AMP-binding protein [Candidatus Gastranaerophilales bacterium]
MQEVNEKKQNQTNNNYDISKFVNNHMFVVKNVKEMNSICDAWLLSSRKYADNIAIKDDYNQMRLTYKDAYKMICTAATALQNIGIKKNTHVAFFSENSAKWMICDQAIMKCGGVNAVRSSAAPLDELKYIYEHSDCSALFTDSKALILNIYEYLQEKSAKFVVYMGREDISDLKGIDIPLYTFDNLLKLANGKEFEPVKLNSDDLATLVYSSGTTGKPKGVMLTNGNLTSQLFNIHTEIEVKPRNSILNVLPIWHMYERTVEYYLVYCGGTLCYTNIRNFKKDLKKYKPDLMVAVPRILEAIYESIMSELKNKSNLEKTVFHVLLNLSKYYKKSLNILENNHRDITNPSKFLKLRCALSVTWLYPIYKSANELIFSRIRKGMGGKFPMFVSGGGAIAPYVEDFFNALNVDILVGYGLTETAPILTVRRRERERNRLYTSGQPLPETEIAIVDPDKLTLMPKGKKGLVLAKGPQVMKGYYKDKEATDKVLLKTGWFITGDLGWVSDDNFLTLTGRAKDIIVLSNGENIEPDVLEQTCTMSDYVKQIVLVGQDKSCLGALIKTDEDAVTKWAQENGVKEATAEQDPAFKKMLLKELNERLSSRPNYRPFERLGAIRFVKEGFTIENGLMTFTAKIRKNVVFDKYEKVINDMYKI